jgi:hypothetical protein
MIRRRAYAVSQILVSVLLLAVPRVVVSIVSAGDQPAPAWLARLLGVRLLFQGCLLARRPTPTIVAAEAGVEAAHGLTMLGLAHVVPEVRRTARRAAALAGGLVLSGLVAYR